MNISGYEGIVETHTGIPVFHSILNEVPFIWIKDYPFHHVNLPSGYISFLQMLKKNCKID